MENKKQNKDVWGRLPKSTPYITRNARDFLRAVEQRDKLIKEGVKPPHTEIILKTVTDFEGIYHYYGRDLYDYLKYWAVNSDNPVGYINYNINWIKETYPLTEYYQSVITRLQALKERYDLEFFIFSNNKWHPKINTTTLLIHLHEFFERQGTPKPGTRLVTETKHIIEYKNIRSAQTQASNLNLRGKIINENIIKELRNILNTM